MNLYKVAINGAFSIQMEISATGQYTVSVYGITQLTKSHIVFNSVSDVFSSDMDILNCLVRNESMNVCHGVRNEYMVSYHNSLSYSPTTYNVNSKAVHSSACRLTTKVGGRCQYCTRIMETLKKGASK